jgi:outer membrane scaffolding protein for murein synthesis (MipA/OmpV family)
MLKGALRDGRMGVGLGVRAGLLTAMMLGLAAPAPASAQAGASDAAAAPSSGASTTGPTVGPTDTRPAADAMAPRKPEIEGAIGLVASYSPSYPGAADYRAHLTPAGFLRWGRFSLTGAGGFTTRRNDEVVRGLGAELLSRPKLQVRLGLRLDKGRAQGDSPMLAGLGDVRQTVRARLSARWLVDTHWVIQSALSVDAGGRGGGYLAEFSLGRQWQMPLDSRLILGLGLSAAGDTYMQAWHGVTAEQATASGLPAYTAYEGLRDVTIHAQWRREFSPRWAGYAGLGCQRLLGSAAASPLTQKVQACSVSSAAVWRF